MSEIVPIVNNGDVVIGTKARNKLLPEDTYRIVGLWAVNHAGDILLARRQDDKLQEPEKWDAAVAGTVLANESYEQAVQRETREELGLADLRFTRRTKIFVGNQPSYFCQTFTTVIPDSAHLVADHSEISALQWFSPAALQEELAENPDDFTPGVAWAAHHLQS